MGHLVWWLSMMTLTVDWLKTAALSPDVTTLAQTKKNIKLN